jgi:hypothetical protein
MAPGWPYDLVFFTADRVRPPIFNHRQNRNEHIDLMVPNGQSTIGKKTKDHNNDTAAGECNIVSLQVVAAG